MPDPVIDLTKHAVIEASAGTGKTYTLVKLVMSILRETKTPLAKILLVTFTEKATGELKARLRQGLEELAIEPKYRDRARESLDSFDQASVFTIHGFCQRMLQDQAFENQEDFASELVSDDELLTTALREVQRTRWTTLGNQLANVLKLSDYDGDSWEKPVTQLVKSFSKRSGHRLLPEAPDDLRADIAKNVNAVRAKIQAMRELARPIESGREIEHHWNDGFGTLSFRKDYRASRQKNFLLPLITWLADPDSVDKPIENTMAFFKSIAGLDNKIYKEVGFRILLKEDAEEVLKKCPHLTEAIDLVEELKSADELTTTAKLLATWTIGQVQEQLDAYKRERGLQSFDDLLTRLDTALTRDSAVKAIRDRFQYAIVDEFQDTDPIQWRIFEKLFAQPGSDQRLFVVGDPKQAIFNFRGADVHAYLKATQTLRDMKETQVVELTRNWRSTPEMLNALNILFEKGKWFGDSEIQYTQVDWPSDEEQKQRLTDDRSQRKALTLVKFEGVTKLTTASRSMARFIAREIRNLLGDGKESLLEYQSKDGESHRLQAGDIAVLIDKRKSALALCDALRSAGIPYSLYKESGLWKSDEAEQLAYLLRSIARPDDSLARKSASLTRYFNYTPEELLDDDHVNPVNDDLYHRWRDLAVDRSWAKFFHSIIHDTGVFFHEMNGPEADRRRANLLHIVNELQRQAYLGDLDLLDIIEILDEKLNADSQDPSFLQPIETDRSKVKVMTIHASKGLEFPVVFLQGGFTGRQTPDFWQYHDGDQRVFDLRKQNEEAKEQHKKEEFDEHRRLYYVALTRAEFKLYLPWIIPGGKAPSLPGPVMTLLAPAIEASSLENVNGVGVVLDVPLARVKVTNEPLVLPAPLEVPQPIKTPDELFPQPPYGLWNRRMRLHSFSSIHRQAAAAQGPTYLDEKQREAELPPVQATEPDPFRGAVFGEMLHDILEMIDYTEVGAMASAINPETHQLVETMRLRHWAKFSAAIRADPEKPKACRTNLAKLVWHALHTPLPEVGPLWKLPKTDRLHELEFHFPEIPGEAPPEVNREQGFFTGYMDLVFRHGGKYYLLDWKSNQLPGGYARDGLKKAMEEADYHRQYRLYLVALERWLRRRDKNFQTIRDFGGVFYLFLRGLNGSADGSGVFFHRPTAADLDLKQIRQRPSGPEAAHG